MVQRPLNRGKRQAPRPQEQQGKRLRAISTSTEETLSDSDSARLSWNSDVTDEELQQDGYLGDCGHAWAPHPSLPTPAALLEFRLSLSDQEKEGLADAAKMVLALRYPAALYSSTVHASCLPPTSPATIPEPRFALPGPAAAVHGAFPARTVTYQHAVDPVQPLCVGVSHSMGYPGAMAHLL